MRNVIRVAGVIGLLVAAGMAQQSVTLDAGYRDMYNLQFEAAHQVFQRWEKNNPQDPLGPVSNAAAYLFAEFDRLHVLESDLFTDNNKFEGRSKLAPDPNAKLSFDAELEKSDALAAQILNKDGSNADAMFAKVLGQGLRGDYAAMIEKRDLAGLAYMKNGRALAQQLLGEHPNYYDAYFAVGAENYLLSQQWAPMRWALRITGAQTDKQTGLSSLRLTAERGHYLLPFARLLLAVAALRDNNKDEARELLAELSHEFPQNQLYVKELTKLQQQTTALQH